MSLCEKGGVKMLKNVPGSSQVYFFKIEFQLEEYSRLEGKLKQSIADLEKREKQLTVNETQVQNVSFYFMLRFISEPSCE